MRKTIQRTGVFLIGIIILFLMGYSGLIQGAEVKTGSYYSKMETPYAEIKSNLPGDEKYDVTTAIPANHPVYVGFGASEFMLNMEVRQRVSSGTRKYSLVYTSENCIEEDEKCIISKTVHTHICEDGKDKKGKAIMKAHNYFCGEACPKCGDKSACPGDQHICSYKKGAVEVGCQVEEKINHEHPHSHIWKGEVNQTIEAFSYIDIEGLELWQTNRLILEGNKKLFVNPHHVIMPFTGYRAFYIQAGYQNNNGRLVFSYSFHDKEKYGNTKIQKTNLKPMAKKNADKAATDWMNQQIEGKKVKVKVISDFLSLTTTEGYQIPMYYEYDSDLSLLTEKRFVTGNELKEIEGNPILFSKQPSFQEMWTKNPYTAAKWNPTYITRSGYNGNYSSLEKKYENKNIVMKSDKTAYLGKHPNTEVKEGEKDFKQNSYNQRMVRTEIDTIEEIPNGFYNTGHCFLEADLEILYGKTNGRDYGRDSGVYRMEVTYANGFTKVNDIIRIKTWN